MKQLKQKIKDHWGYDTFLHLQEQAMRSVLEERDSLVVLPTGGGKSLCFQAPAVRMPGMAVVVSPLISLMKDQVDALRQCGVPAACINSSITPQERRDVDEAIRRRELKLLYVAPERIVTERFIEYIQQTQLSFLAIDEAHCISQWGHDFRPEYRALGMLKQRLEGIAVHAYTATASEHVRTDIVQELGLSTPELLVGSFDRPNLVYTVSRSNGKHDRLAQIIAVAKRHPNESGIVYCISRKNVESTCAELNDAGFRALPYHAGMPDNDRKKNQEAFIREDVEIIVATVAFGMGIDKSNVRYVVHGGMPKSIEHYQQESGRSGRDGLEAECTLIHSTADYVLWKRIMDESDDEAREVALDKLDQMSNFCTGVACRHKTLVAYFGQTYTQSNCGACDICLGHAEQVQDPLAVGQTIIACVLELGQFYGADYTASVLAGSTEERVLERGHDTAQRHGALSTYSKRDIRDWLEQLIGEGHLLRVGEYNVLKLSESAHAILGAERTPTLLKPAPPAAKKRKKSRTAAQAASWEGVDETLFDALRQLRREIANEKGVPAYVVFGDATLRHMARYRPTTDTALLATHGVGKKKNNTYGQTFRTAIEDHCTTHGLATDLDPQDQDSL